MLRGAALVELGLPRVAAFSPTGHLSVSTHGASLRVPLLLRWGNSDAPWERELPGRAPDLLSCSGVSRGLRPTPSGPITAQAPCSLPALPRPRLGAAAPRLDRVPLQGSVRAISLGKQSSAPPPESHCLFIALLTSGLDA